MGKSMLDLELLRSFVSVVDAGGFTRASERVHRTQSTVSQQIKRLEDEVGQPLLDRNGKDVTPTEAGEKLLSYARRLLSLAEEARDVVARPAQDDRRTPLLDDPPGVHDRDPVCDLGYDGQVMRDVDHRDPLRIAQPYELGEQLRLGDDV